MPQIKLYDKRPLIENSLNELRKFRVRDFWNFKGVDISTEKLKRHLANKTSYPNLGGEVVVKRNKTLGKTSGRKNSERRSASGVLKNSFFSKNNKKNKKVEDLTKVELEIEFGADFEVWGFEEVEIELDSIFFRKIILKSSDFKNLQKNIDLIYLKPETLEIKFVLKVKERGNFKIFGIKRAELKTGDDFEKLKILNPATEDLKSVSIGIKLN